MADLKYYDVILRPVITENSMAVLDDKKYTFLVHPEATKAQVKEAVEKTVEWSKEYLNGADMLEVTDRQIREFFA